MTRSEQTAGGRDLRSVRSLRKTHRPWLVLRGDFQIVATFPFLAGLFGGAGPEGLPTLVACWWGVATISTPRFYPWLTHHRARRDPRSRDARVVRQRASRRASLDGS